MGTERYPQTNDEKNCPIMKADAILKGQGALPLVRSCQLQRSMRGWLSWLLEIPLKQWRESCAYC